MPSRTLNRILWLGVLLLIVVFGLQARDQIDAVFIGVGKLDVRDVPEDNTVFLRWRGKIDAPMASRMPIIPRPTTASWILPHRT